MKTHRYQLQEYSGISSKHNCPSCGKNTFTFYIDTESGKHIHYTVGRCDRQSKCAYHYPPSAYFKENNIPFDSSFPDVVSEIPEIKRQTTYFPAEIVKSSLSNYNENYFVSYLIKLFGVEVTSELIAKYFIGTSNHWPGAVIFWQIDSQGRIRTGKIMLYDPSTGKRVREPFSCIAWTHNEIQLSDYQQCLFGEHLLRDSAKPVAIVESEKTAIIAGLYLPQLIWLASGGLDQLSVDKCSVLKGRNVVLFPDLKGFDKWIKKAKELSKFFPSAYFQVSDLLETIASEEDRNNGYDIVDYLIQFDWRRFSIEPKELVAPSSITN